MQKGLMLFAAAAVALAAMPAADAAVPVKHKHVAKHKRTTTVHVAQRAAPAVRGTDRFPAGPLYFNGGVYMGDDPDPFIRDMISRDVSGRFGGSE